MYIHKNTKNKKNYFCEIEDGLKTKDGFNLFPPSNLYSTTGLQLRKLFLTYNHFLYLKQHRQYTIKTLNTKKKNGCKSLFQVNKTNEKQQ